MLSVLVIAVVIACLFVCLFVYLRVESSTEFGGDSRLVLLFPFFVLPFFLTFRFFDSQIEFNAHNWS